MKQNINQIKTILGDLVRTSHSIRGVVVMTRDGLPVASKLGLGVDSERFGAISASLLSLADRAAKDLEQGDLQQVVIENEKGFVLMVKVGDRAVMSIVSEESSRLGRLLVDAKQAAQSLAQYVL